MGSGPELVVVAEQVRTMTGETPDGPHAIVVDRGRIHSIVAAADAPRDAQRVVRVPDGAVAMPGLVDAHSHPVTGLGVTRGIDLTTVRDAADLRRRLAAASAAAEEWVLGWGLDLSILGSASDVSALEEVTGARPMLLRSFDIHAAFANSHALRRAGVDRARELPGAARIETDAHGAPTGVLQEFAAVRLVEDAVPPESLMRRGRRLRDLLAAMAASGLTAAHVMDAEDDPEELLPAVEARSDLPVRLRLSPWLGPADDARALRRRLGSRGRRWRIDGVKLFLDGTIDHGTAWLDAPDVHGASTTSLWSDPEAYTRAVLALDALGIPTATHAIGDAAVRWAARALSKRPLCVHHRIEHLETVTDDVLEILDMPRVAVSMQPMHCSEYVHPDGSDNWSRRLGGRAALGWRTRDIADTGAVLALGSDWPVAPFSPTAIMAAARSRRPAHAAQRLPVRSEQALTAHEALAGFTTAAHQSIGSRGGVLVPGAAADITVLTLDPLHPDADALAEASALLTVIDGQIVHQAA